MLKIKNSVTTNTNNKAILIQEFVKEYHRRNVRKEEIRNEKAKIIQQLYYILRKRKDLESNYLRSINTIKIQCFFRKIRSKRVLAELKKQKQLSIHAQKIQKCYRRYRKKCSEKYLLEVKDDCKVENKMFQNNTKDI